MKNISLIVNKKKKKLKDHFIHLRVTAAEKASIVKLAGGKGKVGLLVRKLLELPL
jgi:hypothetical protein